MRITLANLSMLNICFDSYPDCLARLENGEGNDDIRSKVSIR